MELSASKWVQLIRDDRRLSRLYDKLDSEERHRAYEEAADGWRLDEVFRDILRDRVDSGSRSRGERSMI